MRIRTRSIIIIFSKSLTQVMNWVLFMILVRLIGQDSAGKGIIGTYDQVLLISAFFASIVGLQLENSLYYYLPKLGKEKRGTLLLQTLVGSFAMAAVIGGSMYLLADYVAAMFPEFHGLAPLLRIFALYPFVDRVHVLLPAFFISHDRVIRAAVYSMLISISRALAVLVFLGIGSDLSVVLKAVIGVGAVLAAVGCADMARMCPGPWRFDGRLLLDQFHYAWPLWATTIAGVLNVQFNRLLIAHTFDPETAAVYNRGAMELPLVGMITVSLSAAIMPNLVTLADKGKKEESLDLWQEATRKSSFVIFPFFVFFMIVASDFMVLQYTEAFRNATWPFMVFLCMLPLRVAVYGTLFRAMGRTRPIAISAFLGLAINVIVGTALTYAGGKTFLAFIGPSIGTVVSALLICLYLIWELQQLVGIPIRRVMRWRELGEVLLLSMASGLFILMLPLQGLERLPRLLTEGALFAAAFLFALWHTGVLKPDERQMLLLPVQWVRGRSEAPKEISQVPPSPDAGDGRNTLKPQAPADQAEPSP